MTPAVYQQKNKTTNTPISPLLRLTSDPLDTVVHPTSGANRYAVQKFVSELESRADDDLKLIKE